MRGVFSDRDSMVLFLCNNLNLTEKKESLRSNVSVLKHILQSIITF